MGSIPRLSYKENGVRNMIPISTTAAAANLGSSSIAIAGSIASYSTAPAFMMARRHHHLASDPRLLSSAQFRGAHCIWLGTLKPERAAAMAYSSTAIKLIHRGATPHHNFPWTEPKLASADALIAAPAPLRDPLNIVSGDSNTIIEMFQKKLTPSDVGKLSRLAIPKKHAMSHLPPFRSDLVTELLLKFRDREKRVWKFRYCYWKSSRTYAFTKGWSKFVKEKGLRVKDVVRFYRYQKREGRKKSYFMIDIERNNVGGSGRDDEGMEVKEEEEEEVVSGPPPAVVSGGGKEEKKKVKLFGVWIG